MVILDEEHSWTLQRDSAARLMWARIRWQKRAKAINATAKEAAASLGLKDGTYRQYERAPGTSRHVPLDHQMAIKFARKFRVSWQWLLLGEGTPDDDALPPAQERVMRVMEQAAPEQQEALATMVEAFLRKAG